MDNNPRRIILGKAVEHRTGKGRVQRWRDIKAGKFPAPVEIGANRIGWFEDKIDAWLNSRPRRTYPLVTAPEAGATA